MLPNIADIKTYNSNQDLVLDWIAWFKRWHTSGRWCDHLDFADFDFLVYDVPRRLDRCVRFRTYFPFLKRFFAQCPEKLTSPEKLTCKRYMQSNGCPVFLRKHTSKCPFFQFLFPFYLKLIWPPWNYPREPTYSRLEQKRIRQTFFYSGA